MSEISGIIRNGMERGWPVAEVRLSLINSGYTSQEIDSELNLLINPQNSSPPAQQTQVPVVSQNKFNPQDLTNYQTPKVEQKANNLVVIAIVILLILCVLAGAGLYLFG
ncbi:MAG: hypothetical protein WCI72_05890 [archaeon]